MEKQRYKFNKVVFRVTIGILVLYAVIVGMVFGVHNFFYVSCPSDAKNDCINPINHCSNLGSNIEYFHYGCNNYERYVKECRENPRQVLCTQETLSPGTHIGDFPPFFVRNAVVFFLVIIGLSFAVNHVLYNRRLKDVHNNQSNE